MPGWLKKTPDGQPPPAGRFAVRTLPEKSLQNRSPFGLLPFIIAAVLVVLALNLVSLGVRLFNRETTRSVPPTPAASLHPAAPPANAVNPLTQVQPPLTPHHGPNSPYLAPQVFPHNLQFGTLDSPRQLTIFTDPACGSCRTQLARQLETLRDDLSQGRLHIVIKFWPRTVTPADGQPADLTAGLLLELARRHGLAENYWKSLTHADGDLTDNQLFTLLENQGITLAPLRAELARDSDYLVQTITQDITEGQRFQLPPPPALVLDGRLLTP